MRAELSFRPLFWPTLLTLPAIALMLALGVWQVQRLHWKEDLIAAIDARMAMPPAPVETLARAAQKGAPIAYRHAVAAGRFDHARTRYYFAGTGPNDVPGYHVLTPLLRASGPALLVDRGFVPQSLKDPAARPRSEPEGLVTLTGVVRMSEPPRFFTPRGEREGGVWFSRDVPAIAAAMGLQAEPFFIEADATPNPGGWPVGGQTVVNLRNAHLGYAVTWFSLALALLVVYLLYHRKAGRLLI